MKQGRKLIAIMVVLLVSLGIQSSSAWAKGGSPAKVVKDFGRAYFMLDPSMTSYLSEGALINENEEGTVDLYLEARAAEAKNLGYKTSYLQLLPIGIKTKVLNMDDSSAKIQFNAMTIRSINPLFRIVGFIFGLIEENEVEDIITLVKEDGEWKIGPGAFDMPG
ncbi:MAG: hypothetical protein HOG03_03085 [Desulfobacula sp.]|jgi:hypothetical protein|uniref:hypothetical protein n=1 Tax=Desulfobacula sp. TaxID=2593537 RepID=UPI001DF33979|nr:hypothetical protein [Desulfobacula sp.]MBT3487638.1 hypothetical protein [Desulfobacula sp.]MBT3803565.1 hypothetical protein [Desulfobacula sp.]MBT4025703.1 hypothetical protein [Desulfobacula sp.]MBT4199173.1 hypothetical protein [Desulfobacula sp.]